MILSRTVDTFLQTNDGLFEVKIAIYLLPELLKVYYLTYKWVYVKVWYLLQFIFFYVDIKNGEKKTYITLMNQQEKINEFRLHI